MQVFQICQRMGLVELGNVALDGTKVQASASKHKAMSYERMHEEEERLKEKIQEMLEEAEATERKTSGSVARTEETSFPKNWSAKKSGFGRSSRRRPI